LAAIFGGFINVPTALADSFENYTLGEGLWLSDVHVSGYVTLEGKIPENGTSEFIIDDLSLFINGRFNRFFNPFFEAEIASIPIAVEGHNLFSGTDTKVVLERLYNDSHLTDNLTLRLGKSLTPIGEWNSVHAGPLVPTTTRPLTTRCSFSEFVSGVSLIYAPQKEGLPTVNAYWQPKGELAHDPDILDNRQFHDIKGVNLAWEWGFSNKFGLSFQQADSGTLTSGTPGQGASDEHQYLLGINIHLVKGRFDFQSEFTHIWLDNELAVRVNTQETGIYAQGLYNLNDKWATFARYEYFKDRDFEESSRNAVFGIKYSPTPPLVWKLEYVKQWGQELNISSGVAASLAVLF